MLLDVILTSAIFQLLFIFVNTEKVCNNVHVFSLGDISRVIDCQIVNGNIIIFNFQWPQNSSFNDLVVIKGFLFIFQVKGFDSVGDLFPNLSLINGDKLIDQYSLIIKETDAQTIGLTNLQTIRNGGILIENNPSLCYISTIKWKDICLQSNFPVRILNNRKYCFHTCPQSCITDHDKMQLCWSHKSCQKICSPKCQYENLFCSLNDTSVCCHPNCFGGCYGSSNKNCVSCKYVVEKGACQKNCSNGFVLRNNHTCISAESCLQLIDPSNNQYYSIDSRKCVLSCRDGYYRNSKTGLCIQCKNVKCLEKHCGEVIIKSIRDLEKVKNCISIKDLYVNIQEKINNLDDLLTKSFSQLRVVEKSVKIIQCPSLKTLNFLKSLREIRGENISPKSPSIIDSLITVYENDNLMDLWKPYFLTQNATTKRITKLNKPPVKFALNKRLCPQLIYQFIHDAIGDYQLELVDQELINVSNGDSIVCKQDQKLKLIIVSIKSTSANFLCPSGTKKPSYPVSRSPVVFVIKPTNQEFSSFDILDNDDKDEKWIISDGYMDSEIKITNLIPATRYAIYVESFRLKIDNWLRISDIIYFTTESDAPSKPRSLDTEVLEYDTIRFSWKPPEFPNGKLSYYLVYYRELKLDFTDYLQDENLRRSYCSQGLIDRNLSKNRKEPTKSKSKSTDPAHKCHFSQCLCHRNDIKLESKDNREQKLEKFEFHQQLETGVMAFIYSHQTGWRPDSNTKTDKQLPVIQNLSSLERNRTFNIRTTIVPDTNKQSTSGKNSSFISKSIVELVTMSSIPVTTKLPDNIRKSNKDVPGIPHSIVPVTQENFIFYNLTHYNRYEFGVVVCQNPMKSEHNKSYDKRYCSEQVYIQAVTRPKFSQDNIPSESIRHATYSRSVIIYWFEPPNPNGLITHYLVRFRPIETNNQRWEIRCTPNRYVYNLKSGPVTISNKVNLSMDYLVVSVNISNLIGGKTYEYQIKAFSLESSGNWTTVKVFEIERESLLSLTQKYSIIVGCILILLIILMALLWYYYKKKQHSKKGIVSSNPNYWLIYDIDEWEVVRNKIDMLGYMHPLGSGSFGMVYKGVLRGIDTPAKDYLEKFDMYKDMVNTCDNERSIYVAVKTLNSESSIIERREFINEACYMKQFQSYHLVKLIGIVTKIDNNEPTKKKVDRRSFITNKFSGKFNLFSNWIRSKLPARQNHSKSNSVELRHKTSTNHNLFMSDYFSSMPLVLMELMIHGDLSRYLRARCEDGDITEIQSHLWALQIADGMLYLADNKFVHRDLATRNCMINDQLVVKIGDFGMARDVYYDCYYRKKGGRARIPVRWTAPEALVSLCFTTESDIWSYGVVVWEIATMSSLPYKGMTHQEVYDFVAKGGNPILNDPAEVKCSDVFRLIMKKCWHFQPKKRTNFEEIIEILIKYADDNFKRYSYYTNDQCSSNVSL